MKNSPQQPHKVHPGGLWFAPQTVEAKTTPARPVHPRELTLEQFRQLYFPELVGNAESATADSNMQRDAA